MADNDISAANIFEHGRRNLACEGAFLLPEYILPGESERRSGPCGLSDCVECSKGRCKDDFHVSRLRHHLRKLIYEQGRLRRGLVHLPITYNESSAHEITQRQAYLGEMIKIVGQGVPPSR